MVFLRRHIHHLSLVCWCTNAQMWTSWWPYRKGLFYEAMFECDTGWRFYTLRQQRHVSLVFLVKQLLLRQVALQGLAVDRPIPHQRLAIAADQARSQRFQRLVRDHLHHLQTAQERWWPGSPCRFLSQHNVQRLTCLATAENFMTWRVSS